MLDKIPLAEQGEDSLKKLKRQLKDIKETYTSEITILSELKTIGHNFQRDMNDEGFYSGMVAESEIRKGKLAAYVERLESIIGRLSAFCSPSAKQCQIYDWKTREWQDVFSD